MPFMRRRPFKRTFRRKIGYKRRSYRPKRRGVSTKSFRKGIVVDRVCTATHRWQTDGAGTQSLLRIHFNPSPSSTTSTDFFPLRDSLEYTEMVGTRAWQTIKWIKVTTIPFSNVQQAEFGQTAIKWTGAVYGPYTSVPNPSSAQMAGTDGYKQVYGASQIRLFHRNIRKDEEQLFNISRWFQNPGNQNDYPGFKVVLKCEHTNAAGPSQDIMQVRVDFKVRQKWLGHRD